MDVNKLIEQAILGRTKSYSPYSKFKVGAAILLKNGEYILGCNVENVSYGLTICAERNALFQMVSAGYTKDDVLAFAIVGDTANPISPCGACRQVISELMNQDATVTMFNLNKETRTCLVKDLIPFAFTSGDLHE